MSTKEQTPRIDLLQGTLDLLISVEEDTSENNRRARFYRLTAKGRRQLVGEASKWGKLPGAITRILRPAEEGAQQEIKP